MAKTITTMEMIEVMGSEVKVLEVMAKSGAGLEDLLAEAATNSGSQSNSNSTEDNNNSAEENNSNVQAQGIQIESTSSSTIAATAKSGGKIRIFDKIAEEIRMRYSDKSIVKGAADNEAIFKYFNSGSFKVLKRWDLLFNPNLNVIFPELAQKFPIPYPGKKTYLYKNPVIKKYIQDILGWNPVDDPEKIIKLFKKVKEKNINLIVVGYGGAMINFLYNLSNLKDLVGFNEPIFKSMYAFEKENIAFTNILRLGKPIALEAYMEVFVNSKNGPIGLNKLNLLKDELNLAEDVLLVEDYLTEENIAELEDEDLPNKVFIGAPNFTARKLLEDSNFYFFGHSGHEIEIFYKPYVDTELARETYGSIDIPTLISNIALGTIAQLEIWAKVEDINNPGFENSQSLFKQDMEEYLNN